MLNMTRVNRTLTNRRYLHARELMTLQNNLRWNDDKLEDFWPKHGKRNPNRKRYNDNRKKPYFKRENKIGK
jgi:hypothetical protein